MRNRHVSFVLLCLAGLIVGCDPGCGPSAQQEPILRLRLQTLSMRPALPTDLVKRIYSLDAGNRLLKDSLQIAAAGGAEIMLPYSLRDDETSYLLESATRRDTLTVRYQRVFSYKDRDCGYWVDVQPPNGFNSGTANNPRYDLAAQTTIGRVTYVDYEGTYLQRNLLVDRYTQSEITVTLNLP